MHHPNTTPLKSSYFDYKIYPYREPPEFAKVNEQPHPVVIVGAGPIGLVLAIQLRKHGIACILIESEAQVSGGSRAVALTKRSMEIIEQSNAATRFLEKAITWREGRSFYKNQVVHHLRLPYRDDDKFEPMTNLAQCMMEDILVDEALAQGVDLRFQTALTALKHEADGALLTLDTPQGEYRLKADWVVACDGARSTVRRLMNLRYDGNSFETRFVIVDFKIDLDEPAGRRCYFDPPWLPGQTALMHKTPLGVWRLDYQVPEKLSDEEALDQERIRADVRAHLKYIGVDLPWEIEWTTLYKPNALTLSKYNHGHVIFCGDSAHLLPVFGVRGMNTGVQDSINLGWKLAAVIKRQAPEQILETYSAERVADARQICVEATRSTRMMAPPTRGHRILQQAVLSLALDHEWVRDLLHWRTSHPIDYAESPLNLIDATDAMFSGGPALGAPARNARLDPANRKAGWLLDHFGPAFQVLVFGADAGLLKEAIDDVEILRSRGIAVRLLSIRRQARSSAAQPGVDVALCDPEGHVSGLWGCDDAAVYVVRPDQHVCARWTVVSRARVREARRADAAFPRPVVTLQQLARCRAGTAGTRSRCPSPSRVNQGDRPMKRRIFSFGSICTAALVFGCATSAALAQKRYDPGASDKEILVGGVAPYSGPASAFGNLGKAAAAYFEKVNAEGGVNGRKIRFISLDDSYNPAKTVEQVRKLVEQEEVLLTFNIIGTAHNTAVQKYLNDKKVPQLFAGSPATKFGDPKNFPWTMGWGLPYQVEGRIFAQYVLENKPNGKIAVLYQNDDFGKDYLKGFEDGLGEKAKSMIVARATYEPTDSTVDSQVLALRASGADVFFNISVTKFAVQTIKKVAEIGWKPLHLLCFNSASVGAVLTPAGLDNATGIISTSYWKDPVDPQYQNDKEWQDYRAWLNKYLPGADIKDSLYLYGYIAAPALVQVLKQAGDNLTRANIMKEAANLDMRIPMLLPGISVKTGPDDFYPIEQAQLMRFNGKSWEMFGKVYGR